MILSETAANLATRASGVLLASFLILLVGCGGGNSNSSSGISVSISPTTATVNTGQTEQFTASVSNASNTSVSWYVNNIAGGNSLYGTISSSGLYTAPSVLPSTNKSATSASNTVTIAAASAADNTHVGTASVTLQAAVTISPSSAEVAVTATQQFSSSVNFSSSNTSVTWQVNGIPGGNSTLGTISSTGLYTAPSAIPAATITVTVVSQANTSETASATVTITAPTLTISPTDVTMTAGAQQGFTASALSQTITPAWSVTCGAPAPADCGSIGSDGIYTAPLSPPPGGTVNVVATANISGVNTSTSTTVTVQFATPTLSGRYVFTLQSRTNNPPLAEAGVITFDGQGNIIGGLFDSSGSSGTPTTISGGTYNIGADGRGTAIIHTGSGLVAWHFVVANQVHGFAIETTAQGVSATGTLDLQQVPSGSSGFAQSHYALLITGASAGATPAPFGEAGSLAFNGSGGITNGVLDFNSSSGPQMQTNGSGTYAAPDSNGRATFTLQSLAGSQSFVSYQIDSARFTAIEIDGTHVSAGSLYLQSNPPLSNSTLSGQFAFVVSGWNGTAPMAIGTVFSAASDGSISNFIFDGTSKTVFDPGTGRYNVSDTGSGRTVLTWTVNNGNTLTYALYPRSDGGFFVLETDTTNIAGGLALPQRLPTGSLLVGHFAIGAQGVQVSSQANEEDFVGQVYWAGGTAVAFATLDTVIGSTSIEGVAPELSVDSVNPGTGRAALLFPSSSPVLSGSTLILYFTDADHALAFDITSGDVITGAMQLQY